VLLIKGLLSFTNDEALVAAASAERLLDLRPLEDHLLSGAIGVSTAARATGLSLSAATLRLRLLDIVVGMILERLIDDADTTRFLGRVTTGAAKDGIP
jgi:hypothetical protein